MLMSDLSKIISECYSIPKSKIPSFEMLTSNEFEVLLHSMQIEFSADRFKPHYRYENMSNAQIQSILKMIPIDQKENVIFTVLNQAIDMLISLKNRSANIFQFSNFQFDIDTRLKLAVIYNYFRQKFPDLYGNINRHKLFFHHTLLIFDTYLNNNGEDVYYLVFTCNPRNRSFEKYEQTDSIVVGGEITKKGEWNEEINIDFIKNIAKTNEESVTEYYKKHGDALSYEEKSIELD
jgi:hypothetical protein